MTVGEDCDPAARALKLTRHSPYARSKKEHGPPSYTTSSWSVQPQRGLRQARAKVVTTTAGEGAVQCGKSFLSESTDCKIIFGCNPFEDAKAGPVDRCPTLSPPRGQVLLRIY